eukprot:NODE_269_length_1048_cov_476.073833_g262_i0.p1 GENE.NODE_269_length_1048_cov_476.073833_g262_i0~~NODE_269_length_1048_cov_476.073833_g262_i0.p1  ORF type:complete len:318 (-),score=77.79 NODE_269_length_1048_cov_476.073833_g262_i0:95-946(-)
MSDNCALLNTPTLSATEFDCEETGMQIVTVTIEDGVGHTSTCAAIVDIVETEKPSASCKFRTTIAFDDVGTIDFTENDIAKKLDGASDDNCGKEGLTFSGSPTPLTCGDKDEEHTITLTVSDASGNTATCVSDVVPVDNSKPTANCIKGSVNVELDKNGKGKLSANQINDNSNDNCGEVTLSLSGVPDTFVCADRLSENFATLTVTDGSGNTDTCVTEVDVEDNILPDAKCIGFYEAILTNEPGGELEIDQETIRTVINNGTVDNCGTALLSLDPAVFPCTLR